MRAWVSLDLGWLLVASVLLGVAKAAPGLSGLHVPFDRLSSCPDLPPRAAPSCAKDVRPDDIKTILAIGDSITAGFLALPSPPPDPASSTDSHASSSSSSSLSSPFSWSLFSSSSAPAQQPYAAYRRRRLGKWSMSTPLDVQEYRGLSYPTGADPGAVTIHNILSRYTSLTGGSTGHRPPRGCFNLFGWLVGFGGCGGGKGDGLNGAVSGSTSGSLVAQVKDNLIPALDALEVNQDDWAFVNVGIGANDICAFCLTPNMTQPAGPLVGTPQEFTRGIKDAVELLRKRLPKLIVNIIGVLRVSAIYDLTVQDPYCQGPLQLWNIPHLPLECSCALLPGPLGEVTRRKMDVLGEEYDRAVLEMVRDWEVVGSAKFGALWQPGSAVDLANWPVEALSPVDCFHPSVKAHERVAAGFWNRLTLSLEEKARPIVWNKQEILVRCLEEEDRFPIGQIGAHESVSSWSG